MRVAPALLAALLATAGSCSEPDGRGGAAAPTQPGAGPYVVSAIDYHFHDAHPSALIPLDRGVAFDNDGSNVHNVTFSKVEYSEDFQPGDRLTIPTAELFPQPGAYRFVCRFHADRGMAGVLLLVAESG